MLLDLRSLVELVSGTASLSEGDDSLASAVLVLVQGDAALIQADDTLAAAGIVLIAGSAALTEADDSLAATGVAIVSCSASLTEADESLAATGAVLVQASAADTEDADTLSASGTTLAEIIGALDSTEDDDALLGEALVQDPPAEPVRNWGAGRLGPWEMYPAFMRPIRAGHAALQEADDGVQATGVVAWPQRSRAVREREWTQLRKAA